MSRFLAALVPAARWLLSRLPSPDTAGPQRPTTVSSGPNQGTPDPSIRDQVQLLGTNMSSPFSSAMAALSASAPAIEQLIAAIEALAPHAAGVTKLGMAVNALSVAVPAATAVAGLAEGAISAAKTAYNQAQAVPAPVTTQAA